MTPWLTPQLLDALPDPVSASLQVIDQQLRHYVAAVLAHQTSRAVGEALSLQCEAARLADWAALVGYHNDKLSAGRVKTRAPAPNDSVKGCRTGAGARQGTGPAAAESDF